jgi:negative regulator of flagellin synthesis FlgM
MDIRSSLDGLKSLLGTQAATSTATQQTSSSTSTTGGNALDSDMATFSSAASEVSQTADDSSVRMDKVAGIQAALASGSYSVSAGAVASKVVDSMLAGQ